MHKEIKSFLPFGFGFILICIMMELILPQQWMVGILYLLCLVVWLFAVIFFRNPRRTIFTPEEDAVYAPADGKLVVYEKVRMNEFLDSEMIQLSIFMSPLDVHVNRVPTSGTVTYYRYHEGQHMVAWNPKSSLENERSTIAIQTDLGPTIMMRQIAGAMARRVVTYFKKGDQVEQGDDIGFIRLGSRVDVLLPVNSEVLVSLDQKIKGNRTILARLKK